MGKSLVLGFFDGIHLGHQAVIKSAFRYSDEVILVTFKDSPAKYFGKDFKYILSRQNSLKKIYSLGVQEIVQLDFTQIANMTADDYLKFLVEKFSPCSISTGFNHTFGKNKKGNQDFLKENQERYGYKYTCVKPQIINNEIISSTLIKSFLKNGEIQKANDFLGSKFLLEGFVIEGMQLGRKIGFPTANINYPKDIIKIPYGVYSVNVLGHKGVLNWGMKPTVQNTIEPIAEVHILDFEGDLYNKFIKIEVINRLRGERKFANLDELKQQIVKDIENA